MTDENAREVYRAHREAQGKYIYFLLAAAGGAVVLTVNQTQGAAIGWPQVPLALAVLSWGLSFFFGCHHLGYASSTLYANMELFRVEGGRHPEVGRDPQMMAAASAGIREAVEFNSNRASRLAHWQFRFLVAGAVMYLIWHVFEMGLRTVS